MRSIIFSGALALAVMFAAGEASADITKAQCVEANTAGQNLRREGKMAAAKAQFQTCNDPKCPDLVRTDCTQRYEEIEAASPSIVFDVKSAAGGDLATVKLTVDGQVVAEKLDGTPLRIDPGSHEFKFEAPGEKDVVKTFVLKEGEKLRRERVAFGGDAPSVTPPPSTPPPPPSPDDGSKSGDLYRYGGFGLAAVGVVGLGLGTIFGVRALGKASDQKTNCRSTADCRDYDQAASDHDAAESAGTISTIGFVAGALFLGGAAVLFFTAPKSETQKAVRKILPLAQAVSTGWSF